MAKISNDSKNSIKSGTAVIGLKGRFIIICAVFICIFSPPSAALIAVGMLPSVVALISNRGLPKFKVLSVSALNFAGCFPYVLQIWANGLTIEKGFQILMDPFVIIVIYLAAAVGYMIDWFLTGYIASLLYQRGQARITAIDARQNELIGRWGDEIAGRLPLNAEGSSKQKKR